MFSSWILCSIPSVRLSINSKKAMERRADNRPKQSIPLEVVIEILSWLPFKTLQRFKCVCKLWFELLTTDSHLLKLHCRRVLAKLNKFSLSLEEIYECYYGNPAAYSLNNFIRRLKAYGLFLPYQDMLVSKRASFCNGHFVIDVRGHDWHHTWTWGIAGFSGLRNCPALVLAPTIETTRKFVYNSLLTNPFLSIDVHRVLESSRDLKNCENGVVGTLDCVLEIFRRRLLSPDCIEKFVLYKADELFARGFKDEIYGIFKLLPRNIRVVVISEKIPREALEVPQRFWNGRAGEWDMDSVSLKPLKTRGDQLLRKQRTRS